VWTDIPIGSPAIVIGFVGGFIKYDNPVHGEVQLAERLRKEYPTGLDVETFESHRGARARRTILQLLDANYSGTLTAEEKKNARIIIYGHSWGGSESLVLARALEKVDSVSKPGVDGTLIPANVVETVNFYQSYGLVHGHRIRAADPARPRIIGNFRFDYDASPSNVLNIPGTTGFS